MQSGAATTSEPAEEAPAAIALIGPGCTIERATARFLERYGSDDEWLSAHQRKLERIITGKIDHVAVMLGEDVADVSAVAASDAQRYALISVPAPVGEPAGDSPNPLLDKPIEDSAAVVWLKDLDGRYLRVNGRYVEELGTEAEQVCGRTDAELELRQTIEGMRQAPGGVGGPSHEPLELEYTVAALEDRPAYSVVRFALRDRDDQPIALCGVASPLAQAWVARAECDRLMRIERWSRLDDAELREEILEDWGLAALSDTLVATKDDGEGENQGEQFAAIAAELDAALATSARLDRELAEERRQVMALREASILSARRAHELLSAITAERARAAELEQSVSRAQAREAELEAELTAVRSRADWVEAQSAQTAEALESERSRASQAETALAELRSARELTDSETSAALTAERERRHGLESELAAAQRELERAGGLQDELAAARAELTRVEHAAQEELARVEQAAQEEMARAQQALGEEVERAQQTARSELAREHDATLASVRQELDRARSDAAESAARLAGEVQRGQALEVEITALRSELERLQQTLAESVSRVESETHMARVQGALEAERQTVQALRAELDQVRHTATTGDQAAEAAVAGARAELEAERRAVESLKAELEAERQVVASLKAEVAAAADRPPVPDEGAARALAVARERVQELESELEAMRAAPPAPAPAVAAEVSSVPSLPDRPDEDGPRWGAAAQRALSVALSGVGEWRMVLQQVAKTLTVEGGWDAAIAFCPDERRRLLECAAISTTGALADSTFETQSWQHRPAVTRLEFGAAWGRSEPTAVADLVVAEDRLLTAAAGQGMGSAVFVPVRDERHTLALLALLSRSSGPPPHELMLALEGVGLQVGAIGQLLTAAGAPRWRVGRL